MTTEQTNAAREQLSQMREQMRELSRKMATLSAELGDAGPRSYAYRYIADSDRALLGIVMFPDGHGIKISGVTPGGPADKAGVRNGDVLVAIDGKSVATTEPGKPGKAVASASAALTGLKVDQSVKLDLLRDGKKISVTAKAERREAWTWPRMFSGEDEGNGDDDKVVVIRHPEMRELRERIHDQDNDGHAEQEVHVLRHRDNEEMRERIKSDVARDIRKIRNVHFRMPWWGLNLASLSDDLGVYFGTTRGVLVLSADAESFPTLRSGDVLQSIGSREVSTPEDAMRLLRDAPAGSDLKLTLMRQKKSTVVAMKAPEFKAMFPPLPPEPPVPPAAPLPPTPPAPPMAPSPPSTPAPPAPPTPPDPPSRNATPAALGTIA